MNRVATRVLTALVAILAGAVLAACASTAAPPAPAAPATTPAPTAPGPSELPDPEAPGGLAVAPIAPTTDLPTVTIAELPAEATQTLSLIAAGGPYPYREDGGTFQNREGILPEEPYGFYSEYTVETPGSGDRGARRIVAGESGSRFYTDDHYQSFEEVIQ